MPAYAIGMPDIRDRVWLREYRSPTEAPVHKYGGRYLVRGGGAEVLEGGKQPPSSVVVLEFPSMAQARAWYADPDYAHLIALRQTGAHLDFILIDGLA